MKKLSYLSLTFLCLVSLFPKYGVASLDDLFVKALKTSKKVEVINLNEKKAFRDLEVVSSSVFPTLDLEGTSTLSSGSLDGEQVVDTQLALSLNQKIFQGGSEFAIKDYSKIAPKQAKSQKEASLSEYYAEFTNLFLNYESAEEEVKKLSVLLKNLNRRVEIVKKRTRIGKDRKADLYALESQLYGLEADYIKSKANLSTKRSEFINFSGLKLVQINPDNIDPASLILDKKIDANQIPSLKNLKLNESIAEIEYLIEEGENYPQLDLDLDYYVDKYSSNGDDWKISLNLKYNLFDFGERKSKISSKKISRRIKRAHYDYARLNTNRVWENYYQKFNAKKNEYSLLRRALTRSEASYQQQIQDLKKGLVTQIEVIRSLDDVVNLEKQTIKTSTEVKIMYYQAKAYLGHFPKG